MSNQLIKWDIYEVNSGDYPLTGNRVRGRLRKFCLLNNFNVLAENDQYDSSIVRFAVFAGGGIEIPKQFFSELSPDIKINLVVENVVNPVLSKLKVNIAERYHEISSK